VQSEKRDHIVLVDPVAGNAYAANHRAVAIYRNAAREYLKSVGDTGELGSPVNSKRGAGSASVYISAGSISKHNVRGNVI
jgi:hypothetical protein